MLVEGTIPIHEVTTAVDTTDPAAAVKQFRAEHPMARVEVVGGKIVRGLCESCTTPVFETDKTYGYDHEQGTYICEACLTPDEIAKTKGKRKR